MTLSPWHTRIAAYVVAEDVARLRRAQLPVPPLLAELHAALSRELAAGGGGFGSAAALPLTIRTENVAQRARRTGQSKRTVRRYAAQTGGRKVKNAWEWDLKETEC
jgi:hypothetical protein